MDNYLSGRWPESMIPPAAEPEQKGRKAKKEKKQKRQKKQRKGRGVWRNILVIFLALVAVAALLAGSYFGVLYAAEQMLSSVPQDTQPPQNSGKPDLPVISPAPENTPSGEVEVQWSADMLLEGQPDPSAQITLVSREGAQELTPNEIYKKVLPSIVEIYSFSEVGYKMGTGIVLSQSGYIVTNYHIIETGVDLVVERLNDGAFFYDVALVGYDKELDLAVLKAEGDDFTPAQFGSSDQLEVGDTVYALGNPLGYLQGIMTDGIVSGLNDRVEELNYEGRLIQTSAALNSGNSGGALIDIYGHVVGITYAKVTGVREDVVREGLGLAIPMSDAGAYVNRILRTGDSARMSLGIQCYSGYSLDGVTGMLVSETLAGTPAHGVLLENDLITHVNGVRVYMVDDVSRMLNEFDPGDTVEITLIRQGKEITLTVGLYNRLSELQ